LSRDDRYRAIRSGISMSYWPSSQALELAARKWRALAERRRAHFVELYHSGRWKRYYSEEQFLARLREAIRVSERWAEIAPSLARPSTEVETAASTAAAAAVEPVRTAA
jgi:uncharacterized repeat protein (TIGR03809 family)